MSKMANFFSEYQRGVKLSFYVCAPARVVSYNSSSQRANVQPLYISEHEDGTTGQWPMIEDAPVADHVGLVWHCDFNSKTFEYHQELNQGDTVLLVFGDRAIDNLNGSRAFHPKSNRLHSLTDAFVVAKL